MNVKYIQITKKSLHYIVHNAICTVDVELDQIIKNMIPTFTVGNVKWITK